MFRRIGRALALAASATALVGLGMTLAPGTGSAQPSAQVMHAFATQTLTPAQINSLPSLAGCFGHHGVELSTHIAYECIDQSVSGGALYWSANESNFNWDKHPASGLLWVEASTLHPTADANPPNPFQVFWVGIPVATNSFDRIVPTPLTTATVPTGNFCNVVDPGHGQSPTQCAVDGVVQTMPTQVQDSYNAFATAMHSLSPRLPDCAWSYQPVPNEDACDID